MDFLIKSNGGRTTDLRPIIDELTRFDGEFIVTIEKKKKSRTSLQNRSLHLWFNLLSEALNDAGFDMKKVIRQELNIKWTSYNIKEYLFKPMADVLFGKDSTTKLTTNEIDEVYEVVSKTISERTGVYVRWPCVDDLLNE